MRITGEEVHCGRRSTKVRSILGNGVDRWGVSKMRGDDYPVSSGAHVARPNIERMGWRSPIGRAVSPQFSLPESSWGCAPCWYRARLWRFAALSEQIGQPFSSFKVRNRLWPVENDRQEQVAAKLGVRRFYIPSMTMMLSWMGHPCFCG